MDGGGGGQRGSREGPFPAGKPRCGPHRLPRPGHTELTGRYLLSVELVELGLGAISAPQTQHLGLGAVGHVDEFLVPPALVHRPDVTAQHHAVVTHLRGGRQPWSPGSLPPRATPWAAPPPGQMHRVLGASPRSGFSPDTQPNLAETQTLNGGARVHRKRCWQEERPMRGTRGPGRRPAPHLRVDCLSHVLQIKCAEAISRPYLSILRIISLVMGTKAGDWGRLNPGRKKRKRTHFLILAQLQFCTDSSQKLMTPAAHAHCLMQ